MATEKEDDFKRYEDENVVQETSWSRTRKGRKVSKSTNLQRDVAITLPEFDKSDIEEDPFPRLLYRISKHSISAPTCDELDVQKILSRSLSPDSKHAISAPTFDELDIEKETISRSLSSDSKHASLWPALIKGKPIETVKISELAISGSDRGEYVRESDYDEWMSDVLCEVEKRDELKLGSKHTTNTRQKKGRMKRTGKYVRESDDDEWESDDLCEVEKRDKLKLGSKHTTKTRLKASNKQKGRMKRTSIFKTISFTHKERFRISFKYGGSQYFVNFQWNSLFDIKFFLIRKPALV